MSNIDLRNIVAQPQDIGPPRPLDAGQLIGAGLHGLLNVLGAPRAGVQTVLGGGSLENFQNAVSETSRQWNQMNVPGLSGFMGSAGPITTDIATDPLSYVGLGIPARAAQALRAAGAAPGLIKALQVATSVDEGTAKALNLIPALAWKGVTAPLKIPGSNLGRGEIVKTAPDLVPGIPAAGQPDVIQRVTPKSLYELLAGQNLEGVFKQKAQDLFDLVNHARAKYPVERMVADEDAIAKGVLPKFNPNRYYDAKGVLQNMDQALLDTVQKAPNAYARAQALEVLKFTDAWNLHVWNDALVDYLPAAQRGVALNPRARAAMIQQAVLKKGDPAREMYIKASQDMAANYKSAMDVIEDIYASSKGVLLSRAEDNALNKAVNSALNDVRTARALSPTVGVFPETLVKTSRGMARAPTDKIPDRYQDVVGRTDAVTSFIDRMRGEIDAAGLARPLPAAEDLSGALARRRAQLDFMLKNPQALPGMAAEEPTRLMGEAFNNEGTLARYALEAHKARNKFEKALGDIWERYNPGQKYTPFDANVGTSGKDLLDHFNQVLSTIPTPTGVPLKINSAADFMTNVAPGRLPVEQTASLDKLIHNFPGADLISGDPWSVALERATRQMAGQIGYESPKGIGKTLDLLNSAMKSGLLISGNFPVTNMLSGLLMGQLEGVPALRVARSLGRAMPGALRGEDVTPPAIKSFYEQIGKPIPVRGTAEASNVLSLTGEDTMKYLGKDRGALERIGAPKLAGLGAALGAADANNKTAQDAGMDERSSNIIKGALAGAAGGALMPAAEKILLMRMTRGIEDVLRKEAGFTGTANAVTELRPQLDTLVQDALGSKGWQKYNPPASGAREFISTETSTQLPEVVKWINDREGIVSPDQLRGFLVAHEVPRRVAENVGRRWSDMLDGAINKGAELSTRVNFDYTKNNNAVQMLNNVAPFTTWAVNALPFFVQHLMSHPLFISSAMAYGQLAEKQRKEQGLTARFAGSTEGPMPLSDLWSGILGHPVRTFYNPERGLLPFSESAHGMASMENDQDKPLFDTLQNAMQIIGLPGFHPVITELAKIVGASEEPSSGLPIRQAGPIQGLTAALGVARGQGVDLTAPGRGVVDALRRVAGQDPDNLNQTAILQRIDELALRNTGIPTSANGPQVLPYQEAKVSMQGPIWDQAAQEVARDRSFRQTAGFIYGGLSPSAVLTPEEAKIREARLTRVLDPHFSRDLTEKALRAPNALADVPTQDALYKASVYLLKSQYEHGDLEPGKLPPVIQNLFNNPTNANMKQMANLMQKELVTRNPLYGGYSGSGSPTEAALNNQLSLYINEPSSVPGGQDISELLKYMHGLGLTTPQPKLSRKGPEDTIRVAYTAKQDALKGAHPLLAQYLANKQLEPNLTVEEFLARERKKN